MPDTTHPTRVEPHRDPEPGMVPTGRDGIGARYTVTQLNDAADQDIDCRYSVLDPHRDPAAVAALREYAYETPDEAVAEELHAWVDTLEAALPAPENEEKVDYTCAAHLQYLIKDCPHEHFIDER